MKLSIRARNIIIDNKLTPKKIKKLGSTGLLGLRNCGIIHTAEILKSVGIKYIPMCPKCKQEIK